MLKLWNEVKKEVLNANQGVDQHIINEITKIVYNELKTQENPAVEVNYDLISQLIADFWYANKQAKKCTNRDTIRGYNQTKLRIGGELLKLSQNPDANKFIEEKLGKFYEFVLKHGSAYIPQNNFGRYADYIKFA